MLFVMVKLIAEEQVSKTTSQRVLLDAKPLLAYSACVPFLYCCTVIYCIVALTCPAGHYQQSHQTREWVKQFQL